MIQIILTAICASLFFNYIHRLHIKWNINYKPFSCVSCLSAWLAILFLYTPELILNIATVMFVSGVLSAIGEFYLNKLMYGNS